MLLILSEGIEENFVSEAVRDLSPEDWFWILKEEWTEGFYFYITEVYRTTQNTDYIF